MSSLISNIKKLGFLPLIFYISLAMVGVFHEFVACILTIVLVCGLCYKLFSKKTMGIYLNVTTISVGLITLFYALSMIWAIDRGTAFIGFLKYLPILFFYLLLMNEPENKEKILEILPFFAAFMTVVSVILTQIKPFEDYFSVVGRLAGFFQYPNTFALFLLVTELLIISKEKFKFYDYIILAILFFGILYSGSRSVFVLTALSNFVAIFFVKNRLIKIAMISSAIFVGIIIGGLAILGNYWFLTRISSITLKASSFLGRILYAYDAIPVILKHPFGLGYRGYYYIQQSIQTGVYSVASVHNDFLQIILDIGWIPGLAFLVAFIKPIFSKKTTAITKIIMCSMFLHSCLDFNLQFVAIFFLYLLFTDFNSGKYYELTKYLVPINIASVVLALISLYMSVPLTMTNFGYCKEANKWYSYNTFNETYFLTAITDEDIAVSKANEIISRNPYVTLAYSVKAQYYFSAGDFLSLIRIKNAIFEKFPFQYEEYEEYCYMLANGIELYEQAGDSDSADYCAQELISVPEKLNSTTKRLSKLGKMIKDQPNTILPTSITELIAQLEEEND